MMATHVLNVLLGWGPGPADCPGYHRFHAVSCASYMTPTPVGFAVPMEWTPWSLEPATQGAQGTPWAVPPLVLQSAPCGGVPWLRPRVFFVYPGLSFLIYQVGEVSLPGRKCCGIQCEAVWHLTAVSPAQLCVFSDCLGTQVYPQQCPQDLWCSECQAARCRFCLHYVHPGWCTAGPHTHLCRGLSTSASGSPQGPRVAV